MHAATQIDHLVVASPNLKSGVEWVREVLGVTAQLGGKHQRMGTHNCLLRLGEQRYLEIISPDPNAPRPQRPRWFALDRLGKTDPPRLAAWVVRTTDIGLLVGDRHQRYPVVDFGAVESMHRGELNWLITIRDDGSLPLDGAAPCLIEWRAAEHPARKLRDEGCRLVRLELQHPEPERVEELLRSIHLDCRQTSVTAVRRAVPGIVATVETARGVKSLSSP